MSHQFQVAVDAYHNFDFPMNLGTRMKVQPTPTNHLGRPRVQGTVTHHQLLVYQLMTHLRSIAGLKLFCVQSLRTLLDDNQNYSRTISSNITQWWSITFNSHNQYHYVPLNQNQYQSVTTIDMFSWLLTSSINRLNLLDMVMKDVKIRPFPRVADVRFSCFRISLVPVLMIDHIIYYDQSCLVSVLITDTISQEQPTWIVIDSC